MKIFFFFWALIGTLYAIGVVSLWVAERLEPPSAQTRAVPVCLRQWLSEGGYVAVLWLAVVPALWWLFGIVSEGK